MDKLSREDMLAFENLRLKQQVLNMEHKALVDGISTRYSLVEGDGLDVFTGAITRAARPEPEPKATA